MAIYNSLLIRVIPDFRFPDSNDVDRIEEIEDAMSDLANVESAKFVTGVRPLPSTRFDKIENGGSRAPALQYRYL